MSAHAQSATAPGSRSGPPPPWWKSESFQRDLGLTHEQSARIGRIFEETRPQLRAGWDELDRLEAALSRLIEMDRPEADIVRQIGLVEATRGTLNKTRQLMLLHMHQVLRKDQRVRFDALHERWLKDQERLRQEQSQRQKQEPNRNPNHKPDGKPAPDRRGRPGV